MLEELIKNREKLGYNCEDFGKFVGLSKEGYRQVETGRTKLSYDRAIEIANLFHKKPDDIFLKDSILNSEKNYRFISDSSNNVILIIEEIEKAYYIDRLKICADIFKKWSERKISNGKGIVFSPEKIGYNKMLGNDIAEFLLKVLEQEEKQRNGKLVLDNSNNLNKNVSRKILTEFKNMCFEDKMDVVAELIVKLDNKTLFIEKPDFPKFNQFVTGYDIGNEIINFKKEYRKR